MATSTLNWYPDRGFELDVEAADDDVAVRLVGVPVPADGLAELRAGVDLDRLDILFKASVTIQSETAQLQDARIRLVDDKLLEFDAHIEDVETGDVLPFRVALDVAVPSGAPERGGPRPTPTNEDDLDWEDETTLEQLVVNAPETPVKPDRGGPPNGGDTQAKGLQALLKALAQLNDDEPEEPAEDTDAGAVAAAPDEPVREPTPQRTAPEPRPQLRQERSEESEGEADDQSLGAAGEARSLLDLLVDNDHLELEEDGEVDGLVAGTVAILALPHSAEVKASRLSEWLLRQPQVADLFIGDDDLAEILERW